MSSDSEVDMDYEDLEQFEDDDGELNEFILSQYAYLYLYQ